MGQDYIPQNPQLAESSNASGRQAEKCTWRWPEVEWPHLNRLAQTVLPFLSAIHPREIDYPFSKPPPHIDSFLIAMGPLERPSNPERKKDFHIKGPPNFALLSNLPSTSWLNYCEGAYSQSLMNGQGSTKYYLHPLMAGNISHLSLNTMVFSKRRGGRLPPNLVPSRGLDLQWIWSKLTGHETRWCLNFMLLGHIGMKKAPVEEFCYRFV